MKDRVKHMIKHKPGPRTSCLATLLSTSSNICKESHRSVTGLSLCQLGMYHSTLGSRPMASCQKSRRSHFFCGAMAQRKRETICVSPAGSTSPAPTVT